MIITRISKVPTEISITKVTVKRILIWIVVETNCKIEAKTGSLQWDSNMRSHGCQMGPYSTWRAWAQELPTQSLLFRYGRTFSSHFVLRATTGKHHQGNWRYGSQLNWNKLLWKRVWCHIHSLRLWRQTDWLQNYDLSWLSEFWFINCVWLCLCACM